MLFALLPLALSLAAAEPEAAPAPKVTRVLVLDVTGDLDEGQRSTLTNLLVARLSRFSALEVIAQKNVEKLLGLEAKKQLAGCEGSGDACLADLAGAFNAEIVAVAQAGRLGGATVFTLQLLDQKSVTVGRGTANVSALDDFASKVTEVIDGVGRDYTKTEPSDQAPTKTSAAAPSTSNSAPPELRSPLLLGGAAGLGVGVVVAGVSVIPALLASGANNDLKLLRVKYVDAGRDADILKQATAKQKDAAGYTNAWNNIGVYGFWAGFLVAAAGGAALGASFALPEDAPATPAETGAAQ